MIDPINPDYSNTPASSSRPQFGYLPADPHEHPCVSIITPFFNTGPVFEETARSVMRQSLQQWEWLIVNDGSSNPDSESVLQKYRHIDPRIRVFDHVENRGPSAARNTGFRQARADYVALLDSDDLLEPTALEKWLWFLESRPECTFVAGCSVGFGATGYLWSDGFHSGRKFLQKNMVNITTAMRKSVHQMVGGYREDIRAGLEDWEFWLRCADHGFWGDTVPEYLDWYRRREDHGDRWANLGSRSKQERARMQIRELYAHLEHSFPTCAPRPLEIYPEVPAAIPFTNRLRKNKRRLLLLIPWMTLGGADKFNLDLVSQLIQREWEVTIAATLPGDNCWYPQFAEKTPDIFILDHFLSLTDWPRFICYLIASRQIDHVMISNSDFAYSVLPYLKQQFPNVTFTDFCHMEEEYWKGGGYPRRSVESQQILDMNIVSSIHLKEWMVGRGAAADSISISYTNIDSDEWQPQVENKKIIRRELNIEDDVHVILYAGRIHSQKQPKVFAETMLRLAKTGIPFVALVAGDGPEFQWLRNFVAEHQLQKQVRLLGALPNKRIRQILQGSDLFFLPSKMEGISLAIYEAMACGIAVVGADVGGQRELLTPDCGYLIPRDTELVEADIYAEIISELLNDPEKLRSLGMAGRRRILNGFDLKKMGQRMHELLLQAEERSRKAARIAINPGLGQSLVSMAVDYHRIEKLLRGVWPFFLWIQRNRPNLEMLFPSDKIPPVPETAKLNQDMLQPCSTDEGLLSSLQLLEGSIYNLFAYLPERVLQTYLDADAPAGSPLLQDILAIRRRILPHVDRWRQQKARIALYGIGTHTQALLGTLPVLMPLIQCFLDRRSSGAYLGRPCMQPEELRPADIDVVIYSSKRWESDMHRNLAHLSSIEHVLIYTCPSKEAIDPAPVFCRNQWSSWSGSQGQRPWV